MTKINPQPTRRALLQSAAAVTLGSFLPWVAEAAWPLPEKRPVEMIENIWIMARDGTRLACRLWVPVGADRAPVITDVSVTENTLVTVMAKPLLAPLAI